MLSLLITSLTIILTALDHCSCAEGGQRIIKVAELTNGKSDATCCAFGNCSCDSLDQALANLTNNVLINITTDVTLSSLIKVSDIENVTIIGHNTPTVNCTNYGGMHFAFFHNLIIKAIIWNGCGTEYNNHTEPGLKLSNSSNILVKNCFFQNSKGQTILFSDVSGDINISHCNFAYNTDYRGHGAVIHYSSSKIINNHQQLPAFTINDCNFTYNMHAKSLVYIESKISKRTNITFYHAYFLHNQGISVFIVNQNIYMIGKNLIQNNIAKDAAEICIFNYSTIIFGINSNTTFAQNSGFDGVISLQNHSNVVFYQNSVTTFNANIATLGGAIYSCFNSRITFKENCKVVFSDNLASDLGGAMLSESDSLIVFQGNSSSVFDNNTASHGGAIFSSHSYILFEGNSSSVFNNNTADYSGGAICSLRSTDLVFQESSNIVFSNNAAYDFLGGAIHFQFSDIRFKGNSTVKFSNNTATNEGGALYSFSGKSSSFGKVYFEGYSTAMFIYNIATDKGGAIYLSQSNIHVKQFSAVVFRNNNAEYGGAVVAEFGSKIIFKGNSTIGFTNNTLNATVYSQSEIITMGNATISFNNRVSQWCNNRCLPHSNNISPLNDIATAVIIDNDGVVWCNDQKRFICKSKKCYCKRLENLLERLENMTLVNITDNMTLSSVIKLQYINNVSIIGYNITILCINNGVGLNLLYCSNLSIKGIAWIGCGSYRNFSHHISVIEISWSSGILIRECIFQSSFGRVITLLDVTEYISISNCNFMYNSHYRDHGAAIYFSLDYYVKSMHILTINSCNFSYNINAISVVYFGSNYCSFKHLHLNNLGFHNNQGISIYLSNYYTAHVGGEVLFVNNAAENGAGIYICNRSTVIFDSSTVKFISNSVHENGAAIFLISYSTVMFVQGSIVTFKSNKAKNGTIYCKTSSNVTFKGTCRVTFSNNSAFQYGAAIHSSDNSHVVIKRNSKVFFISNTVPYYYYYHRTRLYNSYNLIGGIIFSEKTSCIYFEENSFTLFSTNSASYGAAILSLHSSMIRFKDHSTVIFNNNTTYKCGVLTTNLFSSDDRPRLSLQNDIEIFSDMKTFTKNWVIFSDYSTTSFIGNIAAKDGTAVFSRSNVVIKDHSVIIFKSNTVQNSSGGAFACYNNSDVAISGFSQLIFNGNMANQNGGGIHANNMCNITITDNSTSTFVNNMARNKGGAIFSNQPLRIIFKGNSRVIFDSNMADVGGALYLNSSVIIFKESVQILFYNNTARQNSGAGYFCSNSKLLIQDRAMVTFDHNMAKQRAGALYFLSSDMLIEGNSTTTLTYNRASLNGGAIVANSYSSITLTENSVLLFAYNEATQSGGAGYFSSHSNFVLDENARVTFAHNIAFHGGALCINNDIKLIFKRNVTVFFYNNVASGNGGGVAVLNSSSTALKDHIFLKFTNNSAKYGGAIFLDTIAVIANDSDKNNADFKDNVATVFGNLLYQEIPELCDCSCNSRITGISIEYVTTRPNELNLYDPAICIDKDNGSQCNNYYIQNIMLGREIVIPACVLDYYNQPVDLAQFLVRGESNTKYFISGPKNVLIACDAFQGISIIGKKISNVTNFSVTITLNTVLYSKWKQISVNLIIELSPCHLGFWQYHKSMGCECYSVDDIVFCSGSNSTIKGGYWFGSVSGKPTVTVCPINYCNFTCCETSSGYYQLSPARDDQCTSHRSGTACGSCADGYTLSFDSTECVNAAGCTTGQTVLVILLTVIYWMVMVTFVFIMMYYRVGIGYLYSITYYYSIVDIILNQNLQASRGLYLTVSIMSSFSKITPQFLGELCLTTGMSGIDQQFIHYVHPSAIILILIIITLLARRSRRISAIISRGIIHVICLLLLLSYTSIASTSLLLMRSIPFHEIDEVYTYLSPNIEYFHGRHLVYGIVALLCTVTIVIGLPLLLSLEPFMNRKFNFTKIKPLLDQFQGCYKDKYRCFASYYMICRLLIITIVIVNSIISNYLLIAVSQIINLIHVTVKPYNEEILNKLDALILHLTIFVTALPLLDDVKLSSVVTLIFVLAVFPLLNFIAITLFLHKDGLKKTFTHFVANLMHKLLYDSSNVNNETQMTVTMKEFYHVTDDSARQNVTTTICDMCVSKIIVNCVNYVILIQQST